MVGSSKLGQDLKIYAIMIFCTLSLARELEDGEAERQCLLVQMFIIAVYLAPLTPPSPPDKSSYLVSEVHIGSIPDQFPGNLYTPSSCRKVEGSIPILFVSVCQWVCVCVCE